MPIGSVQLTIDTANSDLALSRYVIQQGSNINIDYYPSQTFFK